MGTLQHTKFSPVGPMGIKDYSLSYQLNNADQTPKLTAWHSLVLVAGLRLILYCLEHGSC